MHRKPLPTTAPAGERFPGWLDPDNWRREAGRWSAVARRQSAPGENRIDTFDADDVRWL
jgi:hypothetical protein